jgi:hypothetical protein
MRDWSVVSRSHVLAAMNEWDDLGQREFLRRYGFGRAPAYSLWNRGQEYDPAAVLAVAYFHATGTVPRSDEPTGGSDGAARVLSGLGFDVVVDEEALAAEKPRRAKTVRAKPKAARETAPKVCPTCHMALPASGVCDFCD